MSQADLPKVRILALDAGRSASLYTNRFLVDLEAALCKESGNPQARIPDYFDLIAGSGTGAILACMLSLPDLQDKGKGDSKAKAKGRPRYSASQIHQLFFEFLPKAFSGRTGSWLNQGINLLRAIPPRGILMNRHDANSLKKAAQAWCDQSNFSELVCPTLILTHELERFMLHLLCSYDSYPRDRLDALAIEPSFDLEEPTIDLSIQDVCHAAMAEPTYFAPLRMQKTASAPFCRLIGSGGIHSDPSMTAFTEVLERWKTVSQPSDIMIVSVGAEDLSYQKKRQKSGGYITAWGFGFDIFETYRSTNVTQKKNEMEAFYHTINQQQPNGGYRRFECQELSASRLKPIDHDWSNCYQQSPHLVSAEQKQSIERMAKQLVAS